MPGVKYFGGAGGSDLILEPGGELVEDKYGLTTGQLRYKLKPGRHDLKPAYNSAHPLAPFCLLERRRLVMTPGWWTLLCDYAGSEQEESDPEYDLEIGTSREPIETNPRFVSHIGGKPSAPLNGAIFVDNTGYLRGHWKKNRRSWSLHEWYNVGFPRPRRHQAPLRKGSLSGRHTDVKAGL